MLSEENLYFSFLLAMQMFGICIEVELMDH